MYKINSLFPMAIISLIAVLLLCASAAGMDLKKIDLKKISVSDAAAKQKSLIFLDGRPVKEFQAGHIPGARSFSWETYTRTDAKGVPYRTFPPMELAVALGKLGVSHKDAVVVYGDAATSWGGEGWVAWILAWLGHEGTVYALEGGISAWRAKNLAIGEGAQQSVSAKDYVFNVRPNLNISSEEIKNRGNEITLVDTRNYLTEWLPGHLPNAVHIPWEKFYEGPQRRFLSPESLKALLVKNKVDLSKPVVYYCTGGIRSGYAWMVHQLAGLPDAVNFEGGSEEWNRMGK